MTGAILAAIVLGAISLLYGWDAHLRIDAINHRIDRAVSAARQRRDHRGRFRSFRDGAE